MTLINVQRERLFFKARDHSRGVQLMLFMKMFILSHSSCGGARFKYLTFLCQKLSYAWHSSKANENNAMINLAVESETI